MTRRVSMRATCDDDKMSNGERAFLTHFRRYAQALPEPEYDARFNDATKHRFDFVWRFANVYVEIDGGNRMARIVPTRGGGMRAVAVGRHTQSKDYEKRNLATRLGWRGLFFTPEMLDREPQECIRAVIDLLDPLKITSDATILEGMKRCVNPQTN